MASVFFIFNIFKMGKYTGSNFIKSLKNTYQILSPCWIYLLRDVEISAIDSYFNSTNLRIISTERQSWPCCVQIGSRSDKGRSTGLLVVINA